MTRKQTYSDKIKAILTAHPDGGGVVRDWKRLSKHQNDDGSIVRVFENAALGKTLAVTQFPEGRFEVAGQAAVATASASAAPAAQTLTLTPSLDPNPAHNLAADRIMEIYSGESGADEDELEAKMEALAPLAGKALANRFAFALSLDYGDREPVWCVTPIAYWEENGCMDDRFFAPLGDILPRGASESSENMFVMSRGSVLAQAQKFFDAGFIWRRDMQDFIDPNATKFIAAVEAAQAGKGPGSSPPAPQP